jgi:putative ABC transport system substrate-binding protein
VKASAVALFSLALLAALLDAGAAQETGKLARVGFLTTFSSSDVPLWREGLRQGLRDLGYAEGQNLVIEYRYAEGRPERLPALASELVRLKMDVIVVETTPASLALKQATTTIPIVMGIVASPVESGLVTSLARPEGNITGLSLQLPDVTPKRLQLLRDITPTVARVGILWNPDSPITPPQFRAAGAAARALGIQLESLPVNGPDDFDRAFQAATRSRAGALLILDDFVLVRHVTQIAALTVKNRLPAMAGFTGFGEAGGLVSYGTNYTAYFRRAATYVDKILKGAKPGDLPIEQPTNFELVVNLKTAKALQLTIPASVLARADKIIE